MSTNNLLAVGGRRLVTVSEIDADGRRWPIMSSADARVVDGVLHALIDAVAGRLPTGREAPDDASEASVPWRESGPSGDTVPNTEPKGDR